MFPPDSAPEPATNSAAAAADTASVAVAVGAVAYLVGEEEPLAVVAEVFVAVAAAA